MVNRVALDVAMRGLEQHMTDKGVASGKVIDDGDMGFKLVNVLEKFNDMTYSAAESFIRRKKGGKELVRPDHIKQALIDEQTAEFKDLIKPTRLLRSDGDTYTADAVTLEGIFMLMLLLDGPTAIDFRAANSDVFMRHLAGDETLDLERLANSTSTDPIKAALRERLLARRAVSAPAAPVVNPVQEPVAAPAAAPAPVPVAAPAAAPAPVPVAAPATPAVGDPLVGQRRQREDDDDAFNSEREYKKLDFRQKHIALDKLQGETKIALYKKERETEIALVEKERANELAFVEKERANELAFDGKKLVILSKNVEFEWQQLDIRKKNIELDKQTNTRAPAPQPQTVRPVQPQPNNARAPAPKEHNARARKSKHSNTRARQPEQTYPRPKQCGDRLQIWQVCLYLFEGNRINNKMNLPDWQQIGHPLRAEYYKTYNVNPKHDFDPHNRVHVNVYFETDWQIMERVIIQYDNQLRR